MCFQAVFMSRLHIFRILKKIKCRMQRIDLCLFLRIGSHIKPSVRVQKSRIDIRLQIAKMNQCLMIEGGIHHLLLHAHSGCQVQDLLLNSAVTEHTCLKFHINRQARWLQKLIDLLQCRNLHLCILGMYPVEIHLPKLGKGMILHIAGSVADPLDRLVMCHNKLTIRCQLHIQLDPICLHFCRLFKRGKRILRCVRGSSAMCPYQCSHLYSFGPFRKTVSFHYPLNYLPLPVWCLPQTGSDQSQRKPQ